MATSSDPSVSTRKISLKAADEQIFEVEEAIAMEFVTIKSFFEENPSNDSIVPLPNVSSKPLADVMDYCKKELEFRSGCAPEDEKRKFNDAFLKERSDGELNEMIRAAKYLNNKYLFDLLILAVANRIKNKCVEYIRKFFGIEKDFTDEEEARIRAENEWAFEGLDADD